jgi:peptidoglycan/xylan/chitin deacetylase (PgdA/CDA1 family)
MARPRLASRVRWKLERELTRARFSPSLVLLYHRVADVADDPHRLAVSPTHFREQLEVVASLRAVPLRELAESTRRGRPRKGVAVTFDDGYADNLHTALPIAEVLEVPFTVFVVAGKVGDPAPFPWDEGTRERDRGRALDAAELAVLGAHPLVEIGAHTVTHPELARRPAEEQRRELADAKALLEQRLGRSVDGMAYPFGGKTSFTQETMQICRDAGYRYACANVPGAVSRHADPYAIPRVLVRDWSGERLREELRPYL